MTDKSKIKLGIFVIKLLGGYVIEGYRNGPDPNRRKNRPDPNRGKPIISNKERIFLFFIIFPMVNIIVATIGSYCLQGCNFQVNGFLRSLIYYLCVLIHVVISCSVTFLIFNFRYVIIFIGFIFRLMWKHL